MPIVSMHRACWSLSGAASTEKKGDTTRRLGVRIHSTVFNDSESRQSFFIVSSFRGFERLLVCFPAIRPYMYIYIYIYVGSHIKCRFLMHD